jgi:hypothetical protein
MLCYVCGAKSNHACGRCGTVYCGLECQRHDWKTHRIACKEQSIGAPVQGEFEDDVLAVVPFPDKTAFVEKFMMAVAREMEKPGQPDAELVANTALFPMISWCERRLNNRTMFANLMKRIKACEAPSVKKWLTGVVAMCLYFESVDGKSPRDLPPDAERVVAEIIIKS